MHKLFAALSYVIGLFILALGIALIILSDFGAGAWDAFIYALSTHTDFTMGKWIMIIGIFLLILNSLLLRERPDLPALLTIFILGNFVDFWFYVLSLPAHLPFVHLFSFVFGLLFFSIGIAIYTHTRFAVTPIDRLMFVVSKLTGFSIRLSRFISEGFALVLAIILQGPIGIGTIVITFLLGPLVQFFITRMHLLVNRFEPSTKE